MVEFRPVAGFEYDTGVAGDFADLIAPPYDVIDEALRRKLASKSPYNIVHITLPEARGAADKYAAAGEILSGWKARGALVRSGPTFYVIEQRFETAGKTLTRTGVLGQARLSRWREAGIYPHEVTLPKPKADRLALYRATKVAPGPSFSLFEDSGGAVARTLEQAKAGAPWRETDGPEGSHDRIWKIAGGSAQRLSELFANERFFIADGHHRYETALAYRDELARSGALAPDHPANFVLMCAVPFDDPGLVILPTHRLLHLEDQADVRAGLEALEAEYELRPVRRPSGSETARAAIVIYDGRAAYGLEMKAAAREAFRRAAGEVMSGLNVHEVVQKVLPRFFEDAAGAIDAEKIGYTHDAAEAERRVDEGEASAAVILAPVSVRQMAAVASAGMTMPPKSTYFYPKLPTGVVVKPLE